MLTELGTTRAHRSILNLAKTLVRSSVTPGMLFGGFYRIVSQTLKQGDFTGGERRRFTSPSDVMPNGPPLPGDGPQKRQGVQMVFATAARVPQFSAAASTIARIPAAAELQISGIGDRKMASPAAIPVIALRRVALLKNITHTAL